jgi:hypothetical protein
MRVEPALQRERDNTRMGILQDELAKESREMATAENELQSARTSRASVDKIQEVLARTTLHHQNVAALTREIALMKSPVDLIKRSGEVKEASTHLQGRQPDDWLIFRPQVPAGDQNLIPNMLLRRRLPLAESGNSRPQWIIPSGYTGVGP